MIISWILIVGAAGPELPTTEPPSIQAPVRSLQQRFPMPERRPVMRPPEIYVDGPEDLWPTDSTPQDTPRPDDAAPPAPSAPDETPQPRPSTPEGEASDDRVDPQKVKPRDGPGAD